MQSRGVWSYPFTVVGICLYVLLCVRVFVGSVCFCSRWLLKRWSVWFAIPQVGKILPGFPGREAQVAIPSEAICLHCGLRRGLAGTSP